MTDWDRSSANDARELVDRLRRERPEMADAAEVLDEFLDVIDERVDAQSQGSDVRAIRDSRSWFARQTERLKKALSGR